MNNIKELITYLQTLENGASMGELKIAFPDEDLSLKQFIKSGLEHGSIIKDGEKRGTRYYAKGKTIASKEQSIKQEEYDDLERNDLDAYLKSDKPINGQALIVNVVKFGRPSESLIHFLNAGITVENFYIQYDKTIKKNIITDKIINTKFNKIKITWRDNVFTFTKYDMHTNKHEVETFKLYEDLREHIRAIL